MSLTFERLEDRLLLAASAVKQGTTLVITDDGGGDVVTLTGGAEGAIGQVGATGDAAFTGIKNIKIVGGDGVDDYNLVAIDITGNVTADLKGGDDLLTIQGLTDIGGNVTIKGGEGDDNIQINANLTSNTILIGKNVKVDLGIADDGIDFFKIFGDDVGEVITVGGGVTIKGKDGPQFLEIDNVDITRNLNINLGDGDDLVSIGQFMEEAGLEVSVGGNTIIKVGDGDDDVTIRPDGGGDVTFTKNVTIDLGNAAGTDTLILLADDDGLDSIAFLQNLSIKGKAGIQELFLDGFAVTKNAKANLGDGDDLIDVSGFGGSNDSTIGGNLDVKLGNGEDDELLAQRLAITGKTKIDGGAGASDNAASTGAGLTFGVPPVSVNFEEGDLS